jgi:protein-tyrosine phosphatase
MYDSEDGVVFEDLVTASDAVLDGLKKGPTLVHCQAGLNRSGLVAAFTLMRMGFTAQDAIDLLRNSRSPMVLSNETFVAQLHALQNRFDHDQKFARELLAEDVTLDV